MLSLGGETEEREEKEAGGGRSFWSGFLSGDKGDQREGQAAKAEGAPVQE